MSTTSDDGTTTASGIGLLLAILASLAALGTLSTNILLPSLPRLAADFDVPTAATGSLMSSFFATFAIGQLFVGPLSDRFGRRPIVLSGLLIFVVGCVICTVASTLTVLIAGRVVQAIGVSAASVLSRAIARDLFSGNELGRVLSIITVAMAAAPGFSPLVGGGLDLLFGWRSAFAVVAAFGVVIAIAYVFRVGETHHGVRERVSLVSIFRGYTSLLVTRQFIVPAASVALLIGGLFAVFTITPAILVDGLGFSPIALAMFYAGTVFIVFGAGFVAPKLTQRTSLAVAAKTGLVIASGGCIVMAILAGTGFRSFASYLLPMLVFLFGMGLANPTGTALTMSPFGERAGAASALLGFMQMTTAALAIVTATLLPVSAFSALSIVLAILTTMAALIFRLRAY